VDVDGPELRLVEVAVVLRIELNVQAVAVGREGSTTLT
jgi:hypothetical protein